MTNHDKYISIFIESFDINEEDTKAAKYQEVEGWDSVGHMQLIAALEEAFDIMLDTEDIIDFSSFEKGKEILKKYGVEF